MKRTLCKFLVGSILILSSLPVMANTHLFLNGEKAKIDKSPIVVNGRTFLPLRGTGEAMGAIVEWDNATKTITMSRSYKKVVFRLNETTARVNNEIVKLDAPAFSKDNVTYVPIRFIADCLGVQVNYYSPSQIVSLVTDDSKATAIHQELSQIKEVITPVEELTATSVHDYGKAFIGKQGTNVYTGKQLEKVYVVTRSQLPIAIDNIVVRDVWMTSDGNIMAKFSMGEILEALPLRISDNDGFVRSRSPWVVPKTDSNGVMTALYNHYGVEDWELMQEDFDTHTFKDLKYVAFNYSGSMIAISREELLKK